MNDNPLQGKSALVIGGTSGIGYELAQALLHDAASVVVQGKRHLQRMDVFCSQGNTACLICDLQKDTHLEELCRYAKAADILCIAYGPFLQKPLDTTAPEEWRANVYANLILPGILVSSALSGMKERKWGRILLFGGTETHVLRGFKTNPVYGAAKLGITSLIRSVSLGYASFGITANAVCPGFTDTGLLTTEVQKSWTAKSPDGKLLSTDIITEAALFLLKNAAYNGVIMPVDKGWSSFAV